jgi:hypothetical protein
METDHDGMREDMTMDKPNTWVFYFDPKQPPTGMVEDR